MRFFWLFSFLSVPGLLGQTVLDESVVIEADEEYVSPDFYESPVLEERPELPETLEDTIKLFTSGAFREDGSEGFDFSFRGRETYNSNPRISEEGESGVFFTSLSPSASYRSAPNGRAVFVLAGSYSPTFNFYHGGDLNDNIDQRFRGTATYEGAKTFMTLGANFSVFNNSNRLAENFSRSTNRGVNFSAKHEWSERTELTAALDYVQRENSVSSIGNTTGLSAVFSALWEATPLINAGPSLRYARTSSDSTSSFQSISFLGRMDYDFSGKTNFSLSLGTEVVSGGSGVSSSISPTGSLRFDYELDEIWSVNGMISYEAISIDELQSSQISQDFLSNPFQQNAGSVEDQGQAVSASINLTYSPSELWEAWMSIRLRNSPSLINVGETIEDTTFSAGVRRSFGLSQLAFTYSYSSTDFVASGGSASSLSQSFQVLLLSYSHPSFVKDSSLSTNISYSENSGGRNFQQITGSVGLTYRF